MSAFKIAASYRTRYFIIAAMVLSGSGSVNDTPPTVQDLQVAAHVLNFLETPVSGELILAIVFNPADAASRAEAAALMALSGKDLSANDLTLRLRLVEQGQLATAVGYRAIFTTSGVDQTLLGATLKQRHVACLTRHLEQVRHGACIVAIGTEPTVSIVVNAANAAADDVRFATAFRMMVPEI